MMDTTWMNLSNFTVMIVGWGGSFLLLPCREDGFSSPPESKSEKFCLEWGWGQLFLWKAFMQLLTSILWLFSIFYAFWWILNCRNLQSLDSGRVTLQKFMTFFIEQFGSARQINPSGWVFKQRAFGEDLLTPFRPWHPPLDLTILSRNQHRHPHSATQYPSVYPPYFASKSIVMSQNIIDCVILEPRMERPQFSFVPPEWSW
jgi:hypothetical protein